MAQNINPDMLVTKLEFQKKFLKYFTALFVLYSLLLVVGNLVILRKSIDEIDYMLNLFIVIGISVITSFSIARKKII